MKKNKFYWTIMVAVMVTFGLSASAMAFHDGGVAHCDGCHTMHNTGALSETGEIYDNAAIGNLLKGNNASAVCLNCHEGNGTYHVLSDPRDGGNLTPGGDFAWVTLTWTWTERGEQMSSLGDSHGHNVVAPNFGLDVDARSAQAPGGNFSSLLLACSSCHDPHGSKQNKIGPITG